MTSGNGPRPVHILTGYLGSGKTTLLARLLRDPALTDTAVVINELGEVGLDHLLVDRGSEILGVRVDAVTEVLRLRASEIESADVIGAGLAEHVTGLGRPGGATGAEVVVLLDPVALLR